MRKEYNKNNLVANLVFNAPFSANLKDDISGTNPEVHGTISSFTDDGAYFNGAYCKFTNSNTNIPSPSINQSLTFLCDFKNTSTSGHNVILLLQNGKSNRIVTIIYSNRTFAIEKIGGGNQAINAKQVNQNTSYLNCGFSWNAESKTLSAIMNGEIVSSQVINTFPNFSNFEFMIGYADSSSDYFKGYLKNIRVYNCKFEDL